MTIITWMLFGLACVFSAGAWASKLVDRKDPQDGTSIKRVLAIGHNQMALAIFLCEAALCWVLFVVAIIFREIFG